MESSQQHSSAEDTHFYKEPHAILGGDLTSTAKSPMDTLGGLEAVASRVNPEDEVVDKEIELEEEEVGQATGSSSGMVSQDFFLPPEGSSQSQYSSFGAPEGGEGSSNEGQLLHTSGAPLPDKEVNEDVFQEVLQSSDHADIKHRAWREKLKTQKGQSGKETGRSK